MFESEDVSRGHEVTRDLKSRDLSELISELNSDLIALDADAPGTQHYPAERPKLMALDLVAACARHRSPAPEVEELSVLLERSELMAIDLALDSAGPAAQQSSAHAPETEEHSVLQWQNSHSSSRMPSPSPSESWSSTPSESRESKRERFVEFLLSKGAVVPASVVNLTDCSDASSPVSTLFRRCESGELTMDAALAILARADQRRAWARSAAESASSRANSPSYFASTRAHSSSPLPLDDPPPALRIRTHSM
jgi:hypothetical protein